MRRNRAIATTLWAVAVGVSTAFGCLPAGAPPAGTQVVHDRALSFAFFSASESEVVPSPLFCTGPYPASGGSLVTSLYLLATGKDISGTASLADLQLAVDNLVPLSLLPHSVVGRSPPTDGLGRLLLTTLMAPGSTTSPSRESAYQILRFDPGTGARELAPAGAGYLRFSASRGRVFAGDLNAGTLFELQGLRLITGVTGQPFFLGEDFYYVAAAPSDLPHRPPTSSTLTRIRPNAEPEALLSWEGSADVTPIQGVEGSRLLVHQGAAAPPLPGFFVLNPDTLASTPLASSSENLSFVSASPSGRWLLLQGVTMPADSTGYPSRTFVLVEATTGVRSSVVPALLGGDALDAQALVEWRPGRDELWFQNDQGAFKIAEPGDVVSQVPMAPGLALFDAQEAGTDRFSMFTRDGRYYFARKVDLGAGGQLYVSRADDPTLPPLPINPDGTWTVPYWDVGDGRLLVGARVDDISRQELYLVDPEAGTSRTLEGGGQVAAVGKTRALTLLEWDGARDTGALTLIDLASGAQTLLADEVYAVAVDPGRTAEVPPGTDRLAPGTRIAFLSRGRLASPYDGLWVTELP